MLCLYNPYNLSLSAAGGRAVPVRGIFLTVLSAWTKTRSRSPATRRQRCIDRMWRQDGERRNVPTESDIMFRVLLHELPTRARPARQSSDHRSGGEIKGIRTVSMET